jgi:hypothetical protein
MPLGDHFRKKSAEKSNLASEISEKSNIAMTLFSGGWGFSVACQ